MSRGPMIDGRTSPQAERNKPKPKPPPKPPPKPKTPDQVARQPENRNRPQVAPPKPKPPSRPLAPATPDRVAQRATQPPRFQSSAVSSAFGFDAIRAPTPDMAARRYDAFQAQLAPQPQVAAQPKHVPIKGLEAFQVFGDLTGSQAGQQWAMSPWQADPGGHAGEIGSFMRAVAAIESGGGDPSRINYHAQGPMITSGGMYHGQRAYGAYQIMPGNWSAWSKAAGIPGADIRDPRAQDRVAEHMMGYYYGKYGRWDAVAVAWFAGEGNANKYVQNHDLSHVNDAQQGFAGNSVPAYVRKVMAMMGGAAADQSYLPIDQGTWGASEIDLAALDIANTFGVNVVGHEGDIVTFGAAQRQNLDELFNWAREQIPAPTPISNVTRFKNRIQTQWKPVQGYFKMPTGHSSPKTYRKVPIETAVRAARGHAPSVFAIFRSLTQGEG